MLPSTMRLFLPTRPNHRCYFSTYRWTCCLYSGWRRGWWYGEPSSTFHSTQPPADPRNIQCFDISTRVCKWMLINTDRETLNKLHFSFYPCQITF
ncbi:hypothetical protein E2C01_088653 [Portunus trituberculatus]|uniref:Uncharacterized protein n=1 Tax=Portunus trituberculatus TaxID=210409 RepID=A0A5B7J6R5_PORTR|nr:hypothetical protein [Portunus trituberculatus]